MQEREDEDIDTRQRLKKDLDHLMQTLHNDELEVGDFFHSDRIMQKLTGFGRGKIRELLAILIFNGYVSCHWGKSRVYQKLYKP